MPRRSRLTKSFQRKSRNTLILSILAIAAILFLLFRYGLPLISDASFLFGRVTSTDKNDNSKNGSENFVPVPSLDSLPSTTKNDVVKLTGTSLSGLTVQIYLNGNKIEEEKADENGDFGTEVSLTEGENIIKAKAVKEDAESDFSNSIVISFKNKPPELSIDSPSDGSQISGSSNNPIEVKGKTDPDTGVLVNDFQAIVNSSGAWSYFLKLKGGDNEIKVVSADSAGNKTEKIIHVNFSE